jgi:hypothetical protein
MNRIDHTRSEILKLIASINAVPSELSREEYEQHAPHLNIEFRFGFIPPVMLDAEKRQVIVGFCPEVIADTAAEFDDDDFELYLSCMLQLLAGSAALLDELPDAQERQRRAEETLVSAAPSAFSIVSDVQFSAIERGVVKV